MNTLKASTAAMLLAASCVNEAPRPSLAESDAPPRTYNYLQETDFYGLVRRAMLNFQPSRSGTELAQQSDVIVLGQIVAIEDGRTFLGGADDPNSVKTAVARVAVDDVIRGSVPSEVYVAFWRTQVTSIEQFQAALPSDKMLMFLDMAEEQVDTHDPSKGVPDGHTLYELASPQGLAVPLADGQIVQPLTEQDLWLFSNETSLGEVVAQLRLAGPEPRRDSPLTPQQAERNRECREQVTTVEVDPVSGAAEASSTGAACRP